MQRITASLMTLARELTAHAQGIKYVFLRGDDTVTSITQVVYGKFGISDICEMHVYPTMDGIFFFTKGNGKFVIGNDEFLVERGVLR